MSKENVLIFLTTFDKEGASMEAKTNFVVDQIFESMECTELGTVFDYAKIPPADVSGFIRNKIKELQPRWVVGDGTSASALMKMKLPRRILVNPTVAFDDLNNVPEQVRQTTWGFFDGNHEKDYERFLSVFPNAAWYPGQHICLSDLKEIVTTILTDEEP